MITVVDAGPIPLSAVERFDDPDIETALSHRRIDLENALFRLVDVSLADLEDTRWFHGPFPPRTFMVDALQAGALPPIVIIATQPTGTFGILDGLNRTHAHWVLGRETIRAYELLADSARDRP